MSNLHKIVRVMLTLVMVVTLGGFLPFSTTNVLANPGYGTITGNIYEEATGNPLYPTTVRIENYDTGELVGEFSNYPDGSFHVVVEEGSYRLGAGASGYVTAWYPNNCNREEATPITVELDGLVSDISFSLAQGGSITGTVYNQWWGTEQLVSEEPPQPPAEAEAPIAVYTTPSGATYLTIQTWAGEWVVVMGTPPPVDQLMIKTKRALKNVETSLEVSEEQPPEIAIGLPSDQIVKAYVSISFENAKSEDIELGHMTFKIEKEWLEQNFIHKWSVTLNRYDPELSQWIALPTKRWDEDDSYVYYTAAITHFSVFAISGSQTLPPLNFEVANLIITPVEAKTGEDITISADITNLSNTAGTYAVTLWIDGTVEAGRNVSLEAGTTTPVSFTVTRDVEGSYQVRFDRLFDSFNVIEAATAPPTPPLNWWLIIGVIAGVIVITALIYIPFRKRTQAI